MSQTVGELLVSTLADIGATQVFGVVGDALNPFTDALQSCGGAGFRVTQPDQLRETVSRALSVLHDKDILGFVGQTQRQIVLLDRPKLAALDL